MFSDFLKRVICSHRGKKKVSKPLVAKIGPFTVNQCAAVLFALVQERWAQLRTNGAPSSPHLSRGPVTTAVKGRQHGEDGCRGYRGSEYRYLKV